MRFALTAEIAEVSEIEIYPFFSVLSDNSAVSYNAQLLRIFA